MGHGEITRWLLSVGFVSFAALLACGGAYVEGKLWAAIVFHVTSPLAYLSLIALVLQLIWVYA